MGEYADIEINRYLDGYRGFGSGFQRKGKKLVNKKTTGVIRGRIFWAKVIGDPRPNYDGDAREWTFELEVDKEATKFFKDNDLLDRLREPKPDKEGNPQEGRERTKYVILRQKELNYLGEPNKPIRIYESNGKTPWDNRLLGNATLADVKINVVDYGKGKKAGIYPQAIRVLELVPYEAGDFQPLDTKDKYFKKDTFKEDFGLDDEVPEFSK